MGGYIGARAGSLSITTVANAQDITATDTTPEVTIINNTHEDTDGGREGKVIFKGQQSGGEESTLAEIQGSHDGTADDEKGDLIFKTNDGSDGASPTEAMRITSAQKIGIGTNDPTGNVEIATSASDTGVDLVLDGNKSSNGGVGSIIFNNAGDSVGMIRSNRASANDAADMLFYTQATGGANSERMRIDTSGNVGIGTTSPVTNFDVVTESAGTKSRIRSNTDSSPSAGLEFCRGTNSTFGADAYTDFLIENINGGHLAFSSATSGTTSERMRIGSDGAVYIGTTSLPSSGSGGTGFRADSNGRRNLYFSTQTTSNNGHVIFNNPNGQVGYIGTNGSSTTYVTSSDYRLKENVADITDGITRVKQLKPLRFNFIADADKTVDGFLAHEAATVVPEAVSGEKDAVNDEGNIEPQGIDQSKLVPLLTAALQEAIAKIETLETKVAALEAG